VELSGRQTDEYGGQFSNRGNANTSPPVSCNLPYRFKQYSVKYLKQNADLFLIGRNSQHSG